MVAARQEGRGTARVPVTMERLLAHGGENDWERVGRSIEEGAYRRHQNWVATPSHTLAVARSRPHLATPS